MRRTSKTFKSNSNSYDLKQLGSHSPHITLNIQNCNLRVIGNLIPFWLEKEEVGWGPNKLQNSARVWVKLPSKWLFHQIQTTHEFLRWRIKFTNFFRPTTSGTLTNCFATFKTKIYFRVPTSRFFLKKRTKQIINSKLLITWFAMK